MEEQSYNFNTSYTYLTYNIYRGTDIYTSVVQIDNTFIIYITSVNKFCTLQNQIQEDSLYLVLVILIGLCKMLNIHFFFIQKLNIKH
jgi:hypothetical protein